MAFRFGPHFVFSNGTIGKHISWLAYCFIYKEYLRWSRPATNLLLQWQPSCSWTIGKQNFSLLYKKEELRHRLSHPLIWHFLVRSGGGEQKKTKNKTITSSLFDPSYSSFFWSGLGVANNNKKIIIIITSSQFDPSYLSFFWVNSGGGEPQKIIIINYVITVWSVVFVIFFILLVFEDVVILGNVWNKIHRRSELRTSKYRTLECS